MSLWDSKLRDIEKQLISISDELYSTPQMLKEFMEGAVWRDIEATLLTRLIVVRDDLEKIGKADNATMSDITYLQGQAFELRLLLEMPEMLLEVLKDGTDSDDRSK